MAVVPTGQEVRKTLEAAINAATLSQKAAMEASKAIAAEKAKAKEQA